jgi:hypothetical protein
MEEVRLLFIDPHNRSANWRKLAEEARAVADGMQDGISKQTMLEIAERYEVLAAYAERRICHVSRLSAGVAAWAQLS